MENMFSSVRRSLAFRNPEDGDDGKGEGSGGIADKIGSCIRRSMAGFLPKPPYPPLLYKDAAPQIRWRKGELIGCGAYGRVYMGMNLDSGELLAVKQVSIATNNASKQKAQAHIRELEEEVKLLKDLSHKNIVRYLGTAREEDSLNILLEFVPGGSISSLLSKFGSFPEPVIRMYTKQLLKGLEYLHSHGIIHRDIKGANILVDNKGCIKLADFGASKQVVELATVSGAKSMKGTPYWMAPEVILQTGHNFSADIWSVGCTVIEMATGKPPWSQQYQEVAALFHIGTTKSHPPIPEHLSFEAKDFLLQCLQKEPHMRPAASELLKHSFVNGEYKDPHPIFRSPVMEHSANLLPTSASYPNNSVGCSIIYPEKLSEPRPIWEENSCDDMCQIGDQDGLEIDGSAIHNLDPFKSFNPMSEPFDGCPSKFDESPTQGGMKLEDSSEPVGGAAAISTGTSGKKGETDFTFPCGPPTCEDDEELTESKIRAFLDEKALELTKLQSPLYEEFYTLNAAGSSGVGSVYDETNYVKLPPKSRSSPSRAASGTSTSPLDASNATSPVSSSRRVSNTGSVLSPNVREVPSPQLKEATVFILEDAQQEPSSPSVSCSERERKWKEELDQELERKREMKRLEMMRQTGGVGKTSSLKDRVFSKRDRLRFASPGK